MAAAKAMEIDTLHQIDTGLDPVTAEREQWDDGNNTLALGAAGRGRLRAQRRDQRPPRGGRHRGRPDRRLRARLRPRRAALHELPDHPGAAAGGLSRRRPEVTGPRPGARRATGSERSHREEHPPAEAPRLPKGTSMSVSFFDAFTPQEVARISAAGTPSRCRRAGRRSGRRPRPTRPTSSSTARSSVRVKGEEIAQLGPGEIIGEAAIVNHSLRTASIVALTPLGADPLHRRRRTPAVRARSRLSRRRSRGRRRRTASARAELADDSGPTGGRRSPSPPDRARAAGGDRALPARRRAGLTRVEVAERAGVPLEMAEQLWRLLGFAADDDDEVAFTEADVEALRATPRADRRSGSSARTRRPRWSARGAAASPGSRSGRRRCWPASPSRPTTRRRGWTELAGDVLPRVEALQSYIWRRHLVSASSRLLLGAADHGAAEQAVCFVDIVGYTSRSKTLDESELVDWLEHFEDAATGTRRRPRRPDHQDDRRRDPVRRRRPRGRRGDRAGAGRARAATTRTRSRRCGRGSPTATVVQPARRRLRAGVNIASRLTSLARPGTVLVDRRAYEVLSGRVGSEEDDEPGRRPAPPTTPATRRTASAGCGAAGEGLRAAAVVGAAPG